MNLTKVSAITRRIVNILLAVATLYVIFLLLRNPAINLIRAIIPEKNPPITIYGQLPPLRFVSQEIIGENISYELNTNDGKLPSKLPDRMYVFKYRAPQFLYQAAKQAEKDAKTLGFSESDLITDLKGEIFVWRNFRTNSVLTIDTITNALTLETPLEDKKTYFSRGMMTVTGSTEYANTVMNNINRMYPTYRAEVKLGRYSNDKIIESDRASLAELARIDFFRDVGNYPVLGPDAKKGLIHLIIRSATRVADPVNHPMINAYVSDIDLTPEATYPLAPISQAWGAVQNGNGIISNVTPDKQSPFDKYTPVKVNKILINNIYLAYYEDIERQDYLQPVYVFEGNYIGQFSANNGSITIYYPAIASEWVKPLDAAPQE